ncbi:undecaprenyldiphospho-muramoylpentapeptide beta-N-acetylglucosaminyltransferase [Aquisalibacillus elongatus]|uniref:UDP-N-acetylglucosamine--N-acetylmuramyl-(pentapeptide) pyrophosphoryl-undecaprenol N-acetylglucosamine transferase n=1 Tax=Aquisalibacillus elongatus TaxID=485577 RepID=A0A3N5BW27_9BACI|nr:undecaprenyldiphospho-muramoylpentapeptide beta-N-acetylglucosaminyltransferase [Aquisalibacillus elongatus]RPF50115.1 UDP-N-acetylglucosamine-N-acetylmuramylpentapeptide N-acetylglucosamine transferase [Aquisalibacillus elongatus]
MTKGTIVFTGGGTAGHVVVNLALMPEFIKEGYDVHYIGSYDEIERELVEDMEGVTYHGISTGRLRRYLSRRNVRDAFRVVKGVFQAKKILKQLNPSIVFSKGGFVSVPVVMASKMAGVPSIIHESDYTPGLANKIALRFSEKILTTFPETSEYLPDEKVHYIGAIIREELFQGDQENAYELTGFNSHKPTILVMGGSGGAQKVNDMVRLSLPVLLKDFQVVHLCGKGKVEASKQQDGYVQYEYVTDELKDLLAMSDVVISRAGANAIFEFLALRIPMLLIPLSKQQSRGDQILNAKSFKNQGFAEVIEEEVLTREQLIQKVSDLYENRAQYHRKMETYQSQEVKDQVINLIKNTMKH